MSPDEVLGPLWPHHWSEVIAGFVLLILIFIAVRVWVAPRFEALYQERHKAIAGGMDQAQETQRKADEALAKYTAQLDSAREEAAKIREDARNQGAQILAESKTQAQAESDRIVAAGRHQLDAERSQVMGSLTSEIGGMATTLASKVVGESLTDDDRAKRTIDRFIADLEQHANSGSTSRAASSRSADPA